VSLKIISYFFCPDKFVQWKYSPSCNLSEDKTGEYKKTAHYYNTWNKYRDFRRLYGKETILPATPGTWYTQEIEGFYERNFPSC
jgi:hypothetical protein